jgi:hypothetical protein
VSDGEITFSDANEDGSWDGILQPGETMEWQGAPVQSLRWELNTPQALSFVVFGASGVAFFGMIYSKRSESIGNVMLVWLAWLAILTVVYHAWSFWNRRRTFYSLTNKRAFIATRHFGVLRLKAFQIAETSVLRLVDTDPGHVFIAREWVTVRNRTTGYNERKQVDVGFMNIREPKKIFEMLVSFGGRWE